MKPSLASVLPKLPPAAAAEGVDAGLGVLLLEAGESLVVEESEEARGMAEMGVFASATWESGHDGCGIEVVGAEWMPVSPPV